MLRARTSRPPIDPTTPSLLAGLVCLALVSTLLLAGLGAPSAGATSGADAVSSSAVTGKVRAADRRALTKAVADVRRSVGRARSGAALPRKTRPALGAPLNQSRADLGRCSYGEPHDNAGGRLCPRGDTSSERTMVVLGDSHGRHWVPGLQKAAASHGYKAFFLVKEQCTAAMVRTGDPAVSDPKGPWKACGGFRSFSLRTIKRLDPDLVVISTSVPAGGVFTSSGYTRSSTKVRRAFATGVRRLVSKISEASDARTVMLRDVPARGYGTDPTVCYRRRGNDQGDCLSPAGTQRSRVLTVDAGMRAARAAGAESADPTRLVCWRGRCPVVLDRGVLPYRNNSHLTVTFARRMAGALAALLKL